MLYMQYILTNFIVIMTLPKIICEKKFPSAFWVIIYHSKCKKILVIYSCNWKKKKRI